jgi:hypothetical protein
MDRAGNDRGGRSARTGEMQPREGVGRRSFLRNGPLIGAATVGLTTASTAAFTEASTGVRNNWYWCNYCSMIFHSSNAQSDGKCFTAPYNLHELGSSTEYIFEYGYSALAGNDQVNWTWCGDCQVMFYGPDITTSQCAYSYEAGRINAQGYYAHRAGSTTSYDVARRPTRTCPCRAVRPNRTWLLRFVISAGSPGI